MSLWTVALPPHNCFGTRVCGSQHSEGLVCNLGLCSRTLGGKDFRNTEIEQFRGAILPNKVLPGFRYHDV